MTNSGVVPPPTQSNSAPPGFNLPQVKPLEPGTSGYQQSAMASTQKQYTKQANLVTNLHEKTKRDYLQRMLNNKVIKKFPHLL